MTISVVKRTGPVGVQIREYVVAKGLGGGWYRGLATHRFQCHDCQAAIAEGTDVAVRSSNEHFTFLHGICFEQRRRK